MDLLLRGATLPNGRTGVDIGIRDDTIVAVEPELDAAADEEIDVTGKLVTPPFVDAHFHMDLALTYGYPRHNQSGTLLEGIALLEDLRPELTYEWNVERAIEYCSWAVANGMLAIRSHVDITDPALVAVESLLHVKKTVKESLDIQLVAFPQNGYLRSPGYEETLIRALDLGVDVVGGIPHFERTAAEGAQSIRALCEIAAARGLMVDMHCDETDDPSSRHVETLVEETVRLDLQGRTTGSHLCSMHSMDNYYVSKLIPLMAEADLQVVANPTANMLLMGRHDTYPKRRGMTRVKELMAANVNVALAQDSVMDVVGPLNCGDVLDCAHMAVHVGHLSGYDEMAACFKAVTENPARILGLEGYGLSVGCRADMIVLDAQNPVEAVRLRPPRLFVICRGKVISTMAPAQAKVALPWAKETVRFTHELGPPHFEK